MNILFTVFTVLTMIGLVAGDALDDFSAEGSNGRCYSTGCSSGKTCPKFCYGFIGSLAFLEVDADNGVENCAEACASYGKKEGLPENIAAWSPRDQYQGEFICNSFDYRPTKTTNCYLHTNPARGTQGSRPGSTRVDYTEYFCYTRNGLGNIPCSPTVEPTVSPTALPTVSPTALPTALPTGESTGESTACQDDENWTFVNYYGKVKGCNYVAKKPNDNRCSKQGAAEACCACKN